MQRALRCREHYDAESDIVEASVDIKTDDVDEDNMDVDIVVADDLKEVVSWLRTMPLIMMLASPFLRLRHCPRARQ